MKIKRIKLCECGCGQEVKEDKRFVSGHNSRNQSEELIRKRAEGVKRAYQNDPTIKERKKISRSWYKPSEETKKKVSLKRKGMVFTEDHKKNLSISHKGQVSWLKGKQFTEEMKVQRSINQRELWKNKEYRDRQLSLIGAGLERFPNKPETIILNLLDRLYPREWKYTGDFSFWIDGRNPDFTNVNGQKKLIELFGDYWHKGENPQDRIDIFKPFGYETLVIWENELNNMKSVRRKIFDFCEH